MTSIQQPVSSSGPAPAVLAPGDQVTGKNLYQVIRYLGEGLTAQVYLAEFQPGDGRPAQPAALKVLRQNLVSRTQDYFWYEGQILNELREASLSCIPRLIEVNREGPVRFLALEYIDEARFKRLDILLETQVLPEKEALEAARQGLNLLSVLHTRVQRSYTDMQLKNFLWDGATLKALDWNHVSPKRPDLSETNLQELHARDFGELVQRDLTRLGAYLYRMLTGKIALNTGEPERQLRLRGEPAWTETSVATRQIVARALLLSASKRFATAEDFRDAITAAQDLLSWTAGDSVYLEELSQLLRLAKNAPADQEEAVLGLDRAEAILDQFERRKGLTPDTLKRYWSRLYDLNDRVSAKWANGRKYYQADQYREAEARWLPEARDKGELRLWRQVTLARIGAESSTGRFRAIEPDLQAALQQLEDENWGEAVATLRLAFTASDPQSSAQALIGEAEAGQQIADGDEHADKDQVQDWQEAIQAYGKAFATLREKVKDDEYRELISEEHGWKERESRTKDLQRRGEIRQAEDNLVKGLGERLDRDFSDGLGFLQAALRQDPGSDLIRQWVLLYASRAEKAAEPEFGIAQAVSVLEVALRWGRGDELEHGIRDEYTRLVLQRQQIEELAAIRNLRAVVKSRDWPHMTELAQQVSVRASERNPEFALLIEEARAAFKEFAEARSLPAAREIDRALALLERRPSPERRETLGLMTDTLEKAATDFWQNSRLADFLVWSMEQQATLLESATNGKGLADEKPGSAIGHVLEDGRRQFADLKGVPDYDAWDQRLLDSQQRQIEADRQHTASVQTLRTCEADVTSGIGLIGELRAQDLAQARILLLKAKQGLDSLPADFEPELVKAARQKHSVVSELEAHATKSLVTAAEHIYQALGKLESQLTSPTAETVELLDSCRGWLADTLEFAHEEEWERRLSSAGYPKIQLFTRLLNLQKRLQSANASLVPLGTAGRLPPPLGAQDAAASSPLPEASQSSLRAFFDGLDSRLSTQSERIASFANSMRGYVGMLALFVGVLILALAILLVSISLGLNSALRLQSAEIARLGADTTSAPLPTVQLPVVVPTEVSPSAIPPTSTPTMASPTAEASATSTPALQPTTESLTQLGMSVDPQRAGLPAAPFYDIPPMLITTTGASNWQLFSPISDTLLVTGTRGVTETVVVLVNDEPYSGTVTLDQPGALIWSPSAEQAPQVTGTYTMALQLNSVGATPQSSMPITISVETAPQAEILANGATKIRANAEITGTSILTPTAITATGITTGTVVDVLGQQMIGKVHVLRIRIQRTRLLFWLPTGANGALTGPDAYVAEINGKPLTQAWLDAIPPIGP